MILTWHYFLRLEGPPNSINGMHEDGGVCRFSVAVYPVDLSDVLFCPIISCSFSGPKLL